MKIRLAALCLSVLAVLCSQTVPTFAGQVTAEKNGHAIIIKVGDEHFATWNFTPENPKPYFHPVYAPGNAIVVREEIFAADGQRRDEAVSNMGHFHHKGLYLAIDSVNEEKFNYWHEKNQILNEGVEIVQKGDNVVLKVTNKWLDNDKKPILKEQTKYTITPDRMMICELKLTALEKPVTFGDTKEGLLAIRLQKNLRATETGVITNADGKVGEKDCWGIPSAWMDYSGKVGEKEVGVSLFDDPENFQAGRYHVRAYGLFTINPFGQKSYTNGKEEAQELTLQPGESKKLRYGFYVHAGDVKTGKVAEQYQKFLAAKKQK